MSKQRHHGEEKADVRNAGVGLEDAEDTEEDGEYGEWL